MGLPVAERRCRRVAEAGRKAALVQLYRQRYHGVSASTLSDCLQDSGTGAAWATKSAKRPASHSQSAPPTRPSGDKSVVTTRYRLSS
jgi:hypothetical protein